MFWTSTALEMSIRGGGSALGSSAPICCVCCYSVGLVVLRFSVTCCCSDQMLQKSEERDAVQESPVTGACCFPINKPYLVLTCMKRLALSV